LIISACVIGHAVYAPVPRSGAQEGNDIYVTGTLGDSSLGLKLLQNGRGRSTRGFAAYLVSRHRTPTPRVVAGELLARERLATAMIDISDGLLQDLGHICNASGLGAEIWRDKLPLSPAYRAMTGKDGVRHALSGGEDYELLFCAQPRDRNRLENLFRRAKVPLTRIGRCLAAKEGITVLDGSGKAVSIAIKGYDHFRNSSRSAK
jgi:thiamine-monophosphate kinase